MTCPYCNAEEIIDPFPSASQRFTTYKFACSTEIVYCEDYNSVEWDCRDGVRTKTKNFVPDKLNPFFYKVIAAINKIKR
jgi:hypothetical protein